jgi:hypothetical protein
VGDSSPLCSWVFVLIVVRLLAGVFNKLPSAAAIVCLHHLQPAGLIVELGVAYFRVLSANKAPGARMVGLPFNRLPC